MSTKEVAEYLRIKERKIYELVRDGGIPCTRVTGKYLFPRDLIDLWLAKSTEFPGGLRRSKIPCQRRGLLPAATTRCSNGRYANPAAASP
jgi:excisionase family DNA binding protein